MTTNAADRAVVAAIDLGTNSFHMVIADVDHLGFHIITTEKEVVRLGAGVQGFDHLSDDAIDRGIAALRRMKHIAQAHSAIVRAVATSAVREADNGPEFVERVRREVGIDVDVISGAEEARLIALGVRHSLALADQEVLMIDIGGGSTEFTVAKGRRTFISQSIKLGAVRLTDKFFADGVSDSSVNKARAFISSTFAPLANDINVAGFERVVVSSGTCETIARVALVNRGRDDVASMNAQTFSRAEVNDVVNEVLEAKLPLKIAEIPGIEAKRADIIAAGSLLLQEICRQLKIAQLEYSDFALREGVLIDSMEQILGRPSSKRDAARDGVVRFAQRCSVDLEHSEHVAKLSVDIFRSLHKHYELNDRLMPLLEAAAILSNVGASVSYSKHHLHSYYMIRNSDLVGFSEEDIELIALAARYHRKGVPKKSHDEYAALSEERQQDVDVMAGILRIATGLDRSHDQCVRSVSASIREIDGEEVVQLFARSECDNREVLDLNLYTAQDRTALLEEFLGCPIVLKGS
jgi:exopolyphosphatase/guanosine-5'-triphosphate,3'-diphosphate pyrophosphatase